jgi:hypothetical protein
MAQHAQYVRLFSVRMSAVNTDALANGVLNSPDRPKRGKALLACARW